MDYIPQKYVNYFVLRFADKAEIFTVYSTVYRQSDAFPNVQCVKKKKTYPSKCVILMIVQLCNNFSVYDTLKQMLKTTYKCNTFCILSIPMC